MVPAGRHYCHCQSRKCCQCRVYPVVRDCVLFMFGLVRPFMRKLGEIYNSQEIISKTLGGFYLSGIDPLFVHYGGVGSACTVWGVCCRRDYAFQSEPTDHDRKGRRCGIGSFLASLLCLHGIAYRNRSFEYASSLGVSVRCLWRCQLSESWLEQHFRHVLLESLGVTAFRSVY